MIINNEIINNALYHTTPNRPCQILSLHLTLLIFFAAFQCSTDTSEGQSDRSWQPAVSGEGREMAHVHKQVSRIRHILRLRLTTSPNSRNPKGHRGQNHAHTKKLEAGQGQGLSQSVMPITFVIYFY